MLVNKIHLCIGKIFRDNKFSDILSSNLDLPKETLLSLKKLGHPFHRRTSSKN